MHNISGENATYSPYSGFSGVTAEMGVDGIDGVAKLLLKVDGTVILMIFQPVQVVLVGQADVSASDKRKKATEK